MARKPGHASKNSGRRRVKGIHNRLKERVRYSKENQTPGYIIFSMVLRIFDHSVLGKGVELAYYFLFSFLPLIVFATSLISLIHFDTSTLEAIQEIIPDDIMNLIKSYVKYLDSNNLPVMYIGLALSIYFSSAAIRSLMRSLDVAYGVKKGRNPVLQMLISLFFAVNFLVMIVLSVILMLAGGAIIDVIVMWFPDFAAYEWTVNLLRFAVMLIPMFFVFLLLYRFTPHRKLTFRQSLPGALFTVFAWIVVSYLFSFYVGNFGTYSSFYGSMGAVIVLMLWLWLTGVILILGGELNALLIERKQYLKDKQLLDDGELSESVEE